MEEGMLHGVDAYNDMMGQSVTSPSEDWGPEDWQEWEDSQQSEEE
ncbi:MAG: hypothetical protein ACXABY_35460 [Candidatus Thorarchaeota archaeon]|jgi:hypothetical protein